MTQATVADSAPGLPKGILFGAAALVIFALGAVSFARVTDIGAVHMAAAEPVETLSLKFVDNDDGGVSVLNSDDGAVIYVVAPGTNGFIRGTMRGLVQERKRSGIDDSAPFLLTRWNDGTLSLKDPATGRRVNLDAFGPTNVGAFAQFFSAPGSRS